MLINYCYVTQYLIKEPPGQNVLLNITPNDRNTHCHIVYNNSVYNKKSYSILTRYSSEAYKRGLYFC